MTANLTLGAGERETKVPDQVRELVERFEAQKSAYLSPAYNETQVRREFIDPLFSALGWDLENRQGFAEAYKDVIHEDAIKVGRSTWAPDYCFRIGGGRKFYVEAKKPSVSLERDPEPAYQLRRYAWTSKLPLSVLTDFEEFVVYDCRLRPAKTDEASVGRVSYWKYTDYLTRWDEIAGLFSKDAVQRGRFDRYAQETRPRRGTQEVDSEFLQEIERWRELLAKDFALRNHRLSVRDLNFAVQRVIDRVLFLRMSEDRGIEPKGQLEALCSVAGMSKAQESIGRKRRSGSSEDEALYGRLGELFRRADDKYNSSLFYFRGEKGREPPDSLTLSLRLGDEPLRKIISSLYGDDCPYEFSVLPTEILGQVYERFLGKSIHLGPSHRATVIDKPETRKAGGVYYTPSEVVRFVVSKTVGAALEGKTPARARSLRILDPACGSGSFLLGAYQFLLDWYRDRFVEDGPENHRKELYQGPGGQWRLTIQEKKRILLDSIFGVDIDPQAVEVSKLSLLLTVLEGETEASLGANQRLFHERALPDLDRNILCGNSLVGPDFYVGLSAMLVEDEKRLKVNAFNWKDAFPKVFPEASPEGPRGGVPGFDVVIGNPPWGQKEIDKDPGLIQYVRDQYPSVVGIFDVFRPFIEKGLRLTRQHGYFGMVLPDIVLLKDYESTRRLLLERLAMTHIDWWGKVFEDAEIDVATITGRKAVPEKGHRVAVEVHGEDKQIRHEIAQGAFWENERLTFNLHLTEGKRKVLGAVEQCPKLGDYFEAHEGVHSGNIRAELFVDKKVDGTCRRLIFGRDEISPHFLKWNGRYVRLSAVPAQRTKKRYANVGKPGWYERDKLLVRRTGDYVLAALDTDGRYVSNNFFIVFPKEPCPLDLSGLCALLNSEFMTWYFRAIEPREGRAFAELKIKHLVVFPLPDWRKSGAGCLLLNRLGQHRAEIAAQEAEASTPHEVESVRRAAKAVDQQIESAVRNVFGVLELLP